MPDTANSKRRWWIAFDVLILLALSLAGEAGHFSQKQGRAIICGDSAQHVDGAEALLDPDKTPNFGLRKPGYTLLLAGLGALTGSLGWSAIAANHFMMGLLPLAAYGLAFTLRSRTAGWVAAILTIAQLQVCPWDLRIMSEASYTCLMSFGMLIFAIGVSRRRVGCWMVAAGMFLGYAWLIRSVGIAVIGACVVIALWSLRRTPRRALVACACLLVPVFGAWMLECSLNLASSGRFASSTGGSGVMLLVRARTFQGSPLPDTPTARRFLDWVPERSRENAYVANKLDSCVARCRAIRRDGLDEWEFNRLALRLGFETIATDPWPYLKSGAAIALRHLLRGRDGPPLSSVPRDRREPIIVHESARNFEEAQRYWYAYWFLPHRTVEESVALVDRMKQASLERAPFGRTGFWAMARYATMHPLVVDCLSLLRSVGSLWPGFALIACGLLGLNRRLCALLAIAYLLEAGMLAAIGATDIANVRYQFVWLATDMALVACLVTPGVCAVVTSLRTLGYRWVSIAVRTASRPPCDTLVTPLRRPNDPSPPAVHRTHS